MACMYVDGVLLLQTVLYFTIVATGLATSISSAMAKEDFGGNCILYGHATCTKSNGTFSCDSHEFGRYSICSFITAANVFICVFYAFANGCYHAYAVHRSRIIIRVASQMWLRTLLLGSALAFLVTLVAACSITVGLSSWCGNILLRNDTELMSTTSTASLWSSMTTTYNGSFNSTPNPSSSASSQHFANAMATTPSRNEYLWQRCAETQDLVWKFNNTADSYGPSNYYYSFTVAESSCWVNVTIWLLQIIFYTRRLVKSCRHRQQNMYQDPFTTDDAFDVFN